MSANSSQRTGTSELHLRPHHLLCLQTFVGRGYSEEFVEHMTLVKRQLTANPRTPITLVSGADELCAHCPNCVDGQCSSEKPALFDRLVEEKLAVLSLCQEPFPVLEGIPNGLRITEDLIAACCPGCEWRELCSSTPAHKASL
jgi:hypothetical protein